MSTKPNVERFAKLAQDFAEAAGPAAEAFERRKPPVPLQEAFMGRLSAGSKTVAKSAADSLFPEEGLKDAEGNGLLHYAAEGDSSGLAKRLVDEDPSLLRVANDFGRLPLHSAAAAGALESAKALAKAAAEAGLIDELDSAGNSALLIAAASGNEKMVKALLASGANPNLADSDGVAPLHLAAAIESESIVKQLLAAGADPMAVDNRGRTPSHYAALSGCDAVSDAISAAGGRDYEPDKSGKTAEDYSAAQIDGDGKAAALLRNCRERAARKLAM